MEIAKIILSQLKALGQVKMWSWASNSFTAIENGLFFKVHGFKFHGIVKITLKGNDTYTIEFIKASKVEKEFTGVYFDQMVDLIDNYVEYTGVHYEQDVKNATYIF